MSGVNVHACKPCFWCDKCGIQFEFWPMRFVLSLHSRDWHGLSDGQLAAVWAHILQTGGISKISFKKISLPFQRQEVEKAISQVLVDDFLTGDLEQKILIIRAWEVNFFPRINEFFTSAIRGDVSFRNPLNTCHEAARILGARMGLWIDGRWYLEIKYEHPKGAGGGFNLIRGIDSRPWENRAGFQDDVTDKEFDSLLVKWLHQKVYFMPPHQTS